MQMQRQDCNLLGIFLCYEVNPNQLTYSYILVGVKETNFSPTTKHCESEGQPYHLWSFKILPLLGSLCALILLLEFSEIPQIPCRQAVLSFFSWQAPIHPQLEQKEKAPAGTVKLLLSHRLSFLHSLRLCPPGPSNWPRPTRSQQRKAPKKWTEK